MSKKYIYLSHFLDINTPTYGNRDKFTINENSLIAKGDTANSFSICFSTNHMGTHIDLPKHFFDDGKTLNDFDPGYWIYNKVALIDVPKDKGELIIPADLSEIEIDKNCEIILIRTCFEKFRSQNIYWEANPGIDPSVADYLRDRLPRIRTIGFDFISLTSFKHRKLGKEAHRAFLGGSHDFITVIEDMHLVDLPESPIQLIVSPLLINGIDAAPVSVLALSTTEK
ncbi:MAG: cyclase family protein [Ignavibacteriaceae bacterium]|nr:cyclase family protein [Ignavibacteriaceae bacterium]